jgi:lipid II:glycine glycyltransferase (peptidoglycan interpeptide bridge formation enzyme)
MPMIDLNNEDEVKKYDSFVKGYDSSNYMQTIAYNSILDANSVTAYTELNGNIVSGITITLKKAFGKYNYAISLGGPVCDIYDTNAVDLLLKELRQYFKENNVIFIKFKVDSMYTEKLEELYKNHKYKVLRKNTVKYKLEYPIQRLLIDLTSKGYDEALEELSDKVKSNLDNAIRKKMTVKVSSTKRELNLFLDNYRSENIVNISKIKDMENMKKLYGTMPDECFNIYSVSDEDENKLAQALTVTYGTKCYIKYEINSAMQDSIKARTLIYSQIIKDCISQNIKTLDIGYYDKSNETEYLFKRGFIQNIYTEILGDVYKVYKPLITRICKIK